ncbi:MAG: leucine-rich repeat protein [Clostridia bacterium]|nr:leucine-rich repeat protein [Clostridia bacterium]
MKKKLGLVWIFLLLLCTSLLFSACFRMNDGDTKMRYYEGIEGLQFASQKDGTCFVIGIGICTETYVSIPSVSSEGECVVAISAEAFRDCKQITNFVIPASVRKIGERAFDGCTSLKRIIFNGTMEQWDAIEKGARWDGDMVIYPVTCTDGTVPPKNEDEIASVSSDEWKTAFDLSRFESFTVDIYEFHYDFGWITRYQDSIKYNSGISEWNATEISHEGDRSHGLYYRENRIDSFTDLQANHLDELMGELSDLSDYGYSLFAYEEELNCYTAMLNLAIPNTKVSIWFEHGSIVKLEMCGNIGKWENRVYCLCEFTKINATEKIALPIE